MKKRYQKERGKESDGVDVGGLLILLKLLAEKILVCVVRTQRCLIEEVHALQT